MHAFHFAAIIWRFKKCSLFRGEVPGQGKEQVWGWGSPFVSGCTRREGIRDRCSSEGFILLSLSFPLKPTEYGSSSAGLQTNLTTNSNDQAHSGVSFIRQRGSPWPHRRGPEARHAPSPAQTGEGVIQPLCPQPAVDHVAAKSLPSSVSVATVMLGQPLRTFENPGRKLAEPSGRGGDGPDSWDR